MIKRLFGKVVEEEWPIWQLLVVFLASFLAAIIVVMLYFFGPSLDQIQGLSYGPTARQSDIRAEVGGTLFSIPASYTRYGRSRWETEAKSLELHALLPEMSGYSEDQAEAFTNLEPSSRLLLISILPVEKNLTPSVLLSDVFLPQLSPRLETLANGLRKAEFAADSAYASSVFFQPSLPTPETIGSPFYICASETNGAVWCTGRILIGRTAQAVFRFPDRFLDDWQAINQGLTELLRSFRAEARLAK
jgi:hypothetical protein